MTPAPTSSPLDYKVQAAAAGAHVTSRVRASEQEVRLPSACLLSGGKTLPGRSQELAITYLSHNTTLL